MRQLRALLVGAALVAAFRTAQAACADDAAVLRTHLVQQRRAATIWNYAWAIGFGAAAVGQLALVAAEVSPLGDFDRDDEEQLYVGASKATLGMAARLVLPLKIAVPAPLGEPCADVVALRRAVAEAGRRERRAVWLTLIGGTVVNLAGGAILWARRDLETAAISFGTGVPFGPLSAYTQPRGSWALWRAGVSWSGRF